MDIMLQKFHEQKNHNFKVYDIKDLENPLFQATEMHFESLEDEPGKAALMHHCNRTTTSNNRFVLVS